MSAIKAARAFILALTLCWFGAAFADVAVPPLTGRVVDLTGTLSSGEIAAQSQRLQDLERRKGSQLAVLIVPTTQPETIEQYSIKVAEAWKIGRKKIDDGALLVIAKDDHKLRIEVGYGLEGSLTDVTSRRIIDEVIVPRFRSGDFAGGIDAGITRIIAVIDGEPLPRPAPEASHGGDYRSFAPFVFAGFVFCWGISRASFGRLLVSAAIGGFSGVLAWTGGASLVDALLLAAMGFIFAFIFVMPDRYGGVWSGGGGGWSSGSSSGGDFSGGGGSFGGGGASGSW